jgi:hypothetical protein
MKSVLALSLLVATPAFADIEARFTESAPKDRFTFTNVSDCPLGASVLTLDLAGSVAGLIFDTTGAGAGVDVFQPFEMVAGGDVLAAVSPVADGDTIITLTLRGLAPGQTVGFTIDVDDTMANGALGQIRVAGSEIAGASVALTGASAHLAKFDETSRAMLPVASCSS